ncbi:MAG: hypothetical protein CL779_01280 [Chloroflexi bacterium]|nr:hypothetical protein [Chloroflexota bacterium]|tara:strand:- start:1111 stop:1554 length:444 start_codon:yes stop_codon:yes gene_type:complete
MTKEKNTDKVYFGPTPDPDLLNAKEFWEGAKKNILMLPKCNKCKKFFFYPRIICPKEGCHSRDIVWEKASGKGKIYTFAIQHIATDGWKEAVPFVTAFIDTEENVRMLSVIANVNPEDPDSIKIGSNVTIKFDKVEDDIFMPYWEVV